ncbi:MAG TPA: hypothetical protein VHY91_08935 [Pirellulales bacterium]|nr:hypothetical protein [Pirellulales bacterium]
MPNDSMFNDSKKPAVQPRWHARTVLAVAATTALMLVAVTFSPLRSGFADAPSRGAGDIELYQAEAVRIAAGDSYYAAVEGELRERGYPMQSVFNWRTPLPVWLVAVLPQGWAQGLLVALAGAMWLLGLGLLAREFGRLGILAGMATISGAVLPCLLGEVFIMPEVWAGVLIGLSAAAYGTERNRLGCVAALAALLVRELAAPWCLVCLLFDVRARGRRAAAVWVAGFAIYAALYALHLGQVLPRIAPSDIAQGQGWVRFGGAGFLISTVQMNIWLLLAPQWLAALYLAAALLGAAGWSSPAGKRIAWGVVLYAVAFSVAGQAINQYWGSLTAPLFALAVAAAPAGVVRLWRAAWIGRAAVAGTQTLAAG